MLSPAFGCSRLLRYIAAACLLVVVLQLKSLTELSSGNDVTRTDNNVVDGYEQNADKHQTSESSPSVKPVHDPPSDAWRTALTLEQFNDMFERRLAECNTGSLSCPQNGGKLILLDWPHFAKVIRGDIQGENIWCGSIMDAMHKLGYSMLITTPKRNFDDWFRKYHKNVQTIIWERPGECVYDPQCVYADAASPVPTPNATHLNLPIWKIFHAAWWNLAVEPLGGPFTLSPEPYNIWPASQSGGRDNYYLGYTVEPTCLNTPFIPFAQRPRQTYILGKYLGYFRNERYPLTDPVGGAAAQYADDFYLKFSEEEDVTFLAGQFDLFQAGNYTQPPPGITQHPRLPRTEFQTMISKSRVLVGIGNPILSPTPYEALCLGIPFINPIVGWDKNDPENKKSWEGQHGALIHEGIDEPQVYHVKVGDREGFKAALKKAMNTPIDRFIPPRMNAAAVLDRVKTLVETDWRPVAQMRMEAVGYEIPRYPE